VSSQILFPLFATCVVDSGGKFTAGVVDTSGKFATGINDTSFTGIIDTHPWQICQQCSWYRWCSFSWEYLQEFSKKIEMTLM
jgi:hypothetical protein